MTDGEKNLQAFTAMLESIPLDDWWSLALAQANEDKEYRAWLLERANSRWEAEEIAA